MRHELRLVPAGIAAHRAADPCRRVISKMNHAGHGGHAGKPETDRQMKSRRCRMNGCPAKCRHRALPEPVVLRAARVAVVQGFPNRELK
jgi:hypothetical protein